MEGGLSLEEGAKVVAALEGMGLDAVEVSGGLGGEKLNVPKAIRGKADEGYFRPLARAVRPSTRLPLILVGGFRSRAIMEETLAAGEADFISLCRPLVWEPDLPRRLAQEREGQARCISCGRCWPEGPGDVGISCKVLRERQAKRGAGG